jgi:hypothetical protein
MPSLKTINTEESKLYPGVKYKIRTLNQLRRARRDAAIAAERLEYTRVTAERAHQFKVLVGDDGTPEELNAKANSLPVEKRVALWDMDQKAEAIRIQVLMPSTIRAALISVEGLEKLELEGVDPADVDSIIENAPDTLLDELYVFCLQASQLTPDEVKN